MSLRLDGRRTVQPAPRLRGLCRARAWAAKEKTRARFVDGESAHTRLPGAGCACAPDHNGPEHFFFRRCFSGFGYCTATMGCSTAPNWGRRVLPKTRAEHGQHTRPAEEPKLHTRVFAISSFFISAEVSRD